MPDPKKASRKVKNHNRKVRYQSRKKLEDRLTKQLGSRAAAKQQMKGKHVHKTKAGLSLVSPAVHGAKHGRGNKGPRKGYKRK